MKRLQIELSGDLTGDGRPEFRVTPIDIPLPDDVADKFKAELDKLDDYDSVPNNDQFETVFKSKIPVHLSFINTSVPVKGTATIRIKPEAAVKKT